MTEMIERVEKAMLAALGEDQLNLGSVATRDAARAAIKAMQKPTEEMKQAGFQHTGDPCWPEDVGKAWQAMIDAALNEKSPATP